MPLSHYALDQFVSQELSQISECRMDRVADRFPEYHSWLTNFVLNTTLGLPLPTKKRALAFAVIRRSEAAIRDYEEARELLIRLAGLQKTISLYFQCLGRLESTIAMVCQALEFTRKALGSRLYEQGDGSPYERLYQIYNRSRHEDPEKLPIGHLHAVWIKNDGLFAYETHLTFTELSDLVCKVGQIADKLSKGLTPD